MSELKKKPTGLIKNTKIIPNQSANNTGNIVTTPKKQKKQLQKTKMQI